MSAVLDIIIIIILALTIFFAAKKGFVRTLLGGASFVIAVIVAIMFIDPLKTFFLNSTVAENTRDSISDKLAGFVSADSEDYDPMLLEKNSGFLKMISVFGIDESELREKWIEWRHENTETLRADIEEYISEPVVNAVASVAAFLALFVGSLIVLKLLTFLLDRFFRLPVLKQANTFLGVVLGVVIAVAEVYLFVAMVNQVLPYGNELGWKFFKDINADDTILFGWFSNHYIFNIFFG